jgi:hypothetical protein
MELSRNSLMALAVVAVIVLLCVYGVVTITVTDTTATKSSLHVGPDGHPVTDPTIGLISSGSGLRHFGNRSDGYGGDIARFLGGPEPPVFYDSGDMAAIAANQSTGVREGLAFAKGPVKQPQFNTKGLFTQKSGMKINESTLNAALSGGHK